MPRSLFCANSYRFREISILKCWSWTCRSTSRRRSRSRRRKTSLTPFDSKCLNMQCWLFRIILAIRQPIKTSEFDICLTFEIENVGQGHGITIFEMTPFCGKCQNLPTSFFTFLIFAKVRPVRTKATDTHWNGKPMAIDKILQICLKNI